MRSSVGEDQALQSRAEADPREADGVWEGREPHAPWTTEPLNSDMIVGTSQVAQCLRLHAPNAGAPGSILGRRTRSHMLQLRVYVLQQRSHMLQLRPSAAK